MSLAWIVVIGMICFHVSSQILLVSERFFAKLTFEVFLIFMNCSDVDFQKAFDLKELLTNGTLVALNLFVNSLNVGSQFGFAEKR